MPERTPQPRSTKRFFSEAQVTAASNAFGKHLEKVKLLEPEHPFYQRYVALMSMNVLYCEAVRRLGEQIDYAQSRPPAPKPLLGEMGFLLRGMGFAAKDPREERDFWMPDPEVDIEKLRANQAQLGAGWQASQIVLPIVAEMCADASRGRLLDEIQDDAFATLDRKAGELDDSGETFTYLPQPFLGSPMYDNLQAYLVDTVLEAEEYQS